MSPEDTWCSLGRLLELPDLVAIGDMLVTPAFGTDRALTTLDRLRSAAARHTHTPGAERIRAALDLIRVGPLSRPESLYRFACVAVGIPEPLPNFATRILDRNVLLDGAWPDYRSAFEYDGDHHRDRAAFQAGLQRASLIRDEWALLQIGASGLFRDTARTMERTAVMLRAGGWRPDRRIDTARAPRFRP